MLIVWLLGDWVPVETGDPSQSSYSVKVQGIMVTLYTVDIVYQLFIQVAHFDAIK